MGFDYISSSPLFVLIFYYLYVKIRLQLNLKAFKSKVYNFICLTKRTD